MVIDDGSSDATTLVSVMAGAMTHRFATNRGKGEALKEAFEYAIGQGYDWIFTMDGDGRHSSEDIPNFLPLLDQYDLILGDRMTDRKQIPLLRRLANSLSSLIVSLVCGKWISDSQTGFRAYSAKLLSSVQLHSSRYDLETEVIIKTARQGFRIGHTSIQTLNVAEVGRFQKFKDSLRFLRVIAKSLFWR